MTVAGQIIGRDVRPPAAGAAQVVTRWWKQGWLFALVLLVGTCEVYRPAWNGLLLWDDDRHVTPAGLQSLDGLRRIWLEPGATQQYYPLTHTAFWLEHRLWGDSTPPYHLVNIFLHVCSAVLLMLILRRLEIPGAYLAAAIFALHPIEVESVAWISELKNTLSAALCLASVLVYLRFDGRRTAGAYGAALALFVLGLLAKTVVAVMPGAMLVLMGWKRGGISWKRDVLPLIPFFVLGAAGGLTTAWVERHMIGADGRAFEFSAAQRVLIAGRVVCFYLGKLVWPANLTFMYPRWTVDAGAAWQWLFPVGVVAAGSALWIGRQRGALAAMLIFVGALFPVLGFFNVYPFIFSLVADHFQYLAGMSVIALGSAALAGVAARLQGAAKVAAQAGCLLLVAMLALMSWRQSRMYGDNLTLWSATIERNPGCWMAYENRANIYKAWHFAGMAVEDGTKAVVLAPDFAPGRNDLGAALTDLGQYDRAIVQYTRAIELKPDYAAAYRNRGLADLALGRYDAAVADLSRSLDLEPARILAWFQRGNAYQAMGLYARAAADYSAFIARAPAGLPEPYLLRARSYAALHDYDKAWADVDAARKLHGEPDPLFLAQLRLASGR